MMELQVVLEELPDRIVWLELAQDRPAVRESPTRGWVGADPRRFK